MEEEILTVETIVSAGEVLLGEDSVSRNNLVATAIVFQEFPHRLVLEDSSLNLITPDKANVTSIIHTEIRLQHPDPSPRLMGLGIV